MLLSGTFVQILLWIPFALILKMGLAPLHYWGLPVIVGLEKLHALTFLT